MSYLNLSSILQKKIERRRDRKIYGTYNFSRLYVKMDEKKVDPEGQIEVRARWKDLLKVWDSVYKDTRRLCDKWRNGIKRDEDFIKAADICYSINRRLRYLLQSYIELVKIGQINWQNSLMVLASELNLRKDEVYEIYPRTQIWMIETIIRQIFDPIIKITSSLEEKLRKEFTVPDDLFESFEGIMFGSVFRFFHELYEEIIKRQEGKSW